MIRANCKTPGYKLGTKDVTFLTGQFCYFKVRFKKRAIQEFWLELDRLANIS